ncbi:MAG: flavodoxin-dependent (E)-4-hydroxy-3-methylbut-2-enyl-diphosphate synthase [Clostridiales bacterium]|nr:flavodoxin-dependent (E)-4-hydroxy-3-methylbut-2-enyl-diphosphate synthase [Clostridiales bacterium]
MSVKKAVYVDRLGIGGKYPISVQSMTNTPTENIGATSLQINLLADAGADLVRVSVYNEDCVQAVRALVDKSPVPLVADIHFDYLLAIGAMEQGIHKLRINPGNIGDERKVKEMADCAKRHGIPIRIGVNTGSLPKDILQEFGGPTAEAMVQSAQRHIRLLEQAGFDDIVLSLKASDVRLTVEAYRLADQRFDYPLHVGVTEAGLPGQGTIKSAIGIGSLLLDGIGSTVRVSLTGSPLAEPRAALDILKAIGLTGGVQMISCPTCGRTQIDVEGIARELETRTMNIKQRLSVAVMGCAVNGPGEAKEADIAYCGGKDVGALYVNGKFVRKITENPVEEIMKAIESYISEDAAGYGGRT